jgi:hypothetical protein
MMREFGLGRRERRDDGQIPEAASHCPRCKAAVVEDPEIDLGSPVTAAVDENLSGPPSGASFLSWDALLEARLQKSAQGAATDTEEGHEIDLGAPVTASPDDSGPPSGASLLSWDALLKTRAQHLALAEQAAAPTPTLPSGPTLITSEDPSPEPEPAPAPTGRSQLYWVVVAGVGVAVGVVVLFVLRLVG